MQTSKQSSQRGNTKKSDNTSKSTGSSRSSTRSSKSPMVGNETGLLSPTKSDQEFTKISSTIQNQLLLKLNKARKTILKDKDVYINKEHELLCSYYKKILELESKLTLENQKIQLTYGHNVLINNSELDTFLQRRKTNVEFADEIYTYEIKYNEYNKKFVNKIQNYIDIEYMQEFMQKQSIFLKSLNPRELYALKYYTYRGDVYLNAYIDGTFYPKMIQQYGDSIVDEGSDLCYFFYQFLDYFTVNRYYNEIQVPIEDDSVFIEFIQENYLSFNETIWMFVFELYIQELKQIFDKAPLTEKRLVLYRGIKNNYVAKNSYKGYYITNHFSSTSLFSEIAFRYTDAKDRKMLKIIVDKGLPLIFVEGISLSPNEFEVLIPMKATLYIDYASKKINYYKQKQKVICPNIDDSNIVDVTTLIYTNYSS